MVSHSGHGVRP